MLGSRPVFNYLFLAYLCTGFHSIRMHFSTTNQPAAPAHAHPRMPSGALRHICTCDATEQAKAQEGWNLEYEQISAGRFAGELALLELPGLSLIQESANQSIRQQGDLCRDSHLFAFITPAPGRHAVFAGHDVQAHQMLVGAGTDLDLWCPAGFSLSGMVVDLNWLLSLWEQTHAGPAPAWLHQRCVVTLSESMGAHLQHLHRQALAQSRALTPQTPARAAVPPSAALHSMRDALLLAWLDQIPHEASESMAASRQARKRIVDKACAHMLVLRDGEPLSMLDICRHIGVSHRKLNYCFQDILGLSPLHYQRMVRLNRVRWTLQQAPVGSQVQDIAAQWGFWHMGQFGQDYKRHFGETPSATLRGASGVSP